MVDWDSKLKKVESVVSSLLTSSFSVTTFLVITLISRVFDSLSSRLQKTAKNTENLAKFKLANLNTHIQNSNHSKKIY